MMFAGDPCCMLGAVTIGRKIALQVYMDSITAYNHTVLIYILRYLTQPCILWLVYNLQKESGGMNGGKSTPGPFSLSIVTVHS